MTIFTKKEEHRIGWGERHRRDQCSVCRGSRGRRCRTPFPEASGFQVPGALCRRHPVSDHRRLSPCHRPDSRQRHARAAAAPCRRRHIHGGRIVLLPQLLHAGRHPRSGQAAAGRSRQSLGRPQGTHRFDPLPLIFHCPARQSHADRRQDRTRPRDDRRLPQERSLPHPRPVRASPGSDLSYHAPPPQASRQQPPGQEGQVLVHNPRIGILYPDDRSLAIDNKGIPVHIHQRDRQGPYGYPYPLGRSRSSWPSIRRR